MNKKEKNDKLPACEKKSHEVNDREFWKKAIVALDANILLQLYEFTSNTRQDWQIALLLLKEENRLFIPYQAFYEYRKHVDDKIESISEKLPTELKVAFQLRERSKEFKKKEVHPLWAEILEELYLKQERLTKTMINVIDQQIKQWKKGYHKETEQLQEWIVENLTENIGLKPTLEEQELILREAKSRFEQNIPPGYMDKDKIRVKRGDREPHGNPYGDYFIWKELLKIAIDSSMPILFVTNDLKVDWFYKNRPRKELSEEMRSTTGQEFHAVTAEEFANWIPSFIGKSNSTAPVESHRLNQILKGDSIYSGVLLDRKAYNSLRDVENIEQIFSDVKANALDLEPGEYLETVHGDNIRIRYRVDDEGIVHIEDTLWIN